MNQGDGGQVQEQADALKIRRWVALALGLVALAVVAVVLTIVFIDRIAASAVERGATYALGVQTSVGSMDIGLFGGEVGLGDLEVDNPDGYETDHFLKLDEADLAVTLGTLRQDTVRVPRLALTGIDMNLEKKKGKANYEVILENLQRVQGQPQPGAADKPGKKFVIDELVIRDVTVHTDLLGVGGSLTRLKVQIPEIRLEEVGSDSDRGVLLSELSGIVTKAILEAVVRKAGRELPGEVVGVLRDKLGDLDGLRTRGMEVAGEVTDRAGKVVGEIGERVQDVGEKVKEGLGGLKDALGGKKRNGGGEESR